MTKTLGLAAAAVAVMLALPGTAQAASVEIEVLSSRADLVSGGDALVRLGGVERSADASGLRVTLGSTDVTKQFARRPNGQIEALLTGVPNGRSVLTATVPGGHGAHLAINGHPNGGPLIAGPQPQPWKCQDTAVDTQCNQPAKYELLAATETGFVAYDPKSPPPGIKQTTTTNGETVPFIVRLETGYQDRDQYKVATLYDPSKPWEPWAPQKPWNGRLIITHGGSCGTDRQAGEAPEVLVEELLGKGYMVGSTALNNLGHNCNPAIVAESELMMHERIVESYGPVRAVIGTGGSGGSIAQIMVAHAYPGFYDGITTGLTFADLLTTGKHGVAGHLFKNFFNGASASGGQAYTPADQALVNGSPLATGDDFFFDTAFWPAIDGTGSCVGLPEGQRWTPQNPSGVRCGVLDLNVSILGKGRTGYVGMPFDNVGVQYGLKALEQGLLSPAKFVDINARIGGLDEASLQLSPERHEADFDALRNAYRSGYMAVGNTLAQTPFLEMRGSNETVGHVTYPTKALDARLTRYTGSTRSHALYQGVVPLNGSVDAVNRLIYDMDRWVTAIQKDGRDVPSTKKIVDDRPADITDHCEYGSAGVSRPGTDCPEAVRYYDSPTQVAGESARNDILKCQLKPLRREDYKTTFTDEQWATLQKTFPAGVCDWSKPGVGETETVPWLTYEDGPGGKPLGSPPRSVPFSARNAKRVKVILTRVVLSGRRLRVGCRLQGAPLRSCRITVLVRRGGKLRSLRTVTVRGGRKAIVRTGAARRMVLRAQAFAKDGHRFTARRSLHRSR